MSAKCDLCHRYNFEFCNKKPPCPDVVDLVNCLGVIFKSNRTRNLFDGNLEATLQEYNQEEEDKFYATSYAIASKSELNLVTVSEFKLLQRVVKLGSGRYKRLNYSEKDFVLIPAHWAHEVRILKKYILRLQSLDLTLDYEFIKEEADRVDLNKILWTDGGSLGPPKNTTKFLLQLISN